jgi:hypothetical protein
LPLTETLPVLLTTPEVALDVVQLSKMQFDVVLVDEAHNIPKQECYHLFEMAKHLVVFGDARQDMTPFAEDDILEFCKGIGAKTHNLDYQHQDTPEGWVRFNKIAFGTPFKRTPSGRSALDSTVVVNVEGRYDETQAPMKPKPARSSTGSTSSSPRPPTCIRWWALPVPRCNSAT